MSIDIMTRLRMFSLDDGTDALNILLAECIDEIKYLRTENDKASAFWKGLKMNNEAYFNIKTYCDDLTERLRLVEECKLRHPDWDTQPFRRDEWDGDKTEDDEKLTFKSSFDPNDLRPHTSDLLTSERWNDLMLVALAAFEKAAQNDPR